MKRRGDIDHVLEAWLLDGPSEMPDRLFEAVFDRVERVPQRRLARLHPRFTEMTTTARLIAAIAAAVLIVGVGLAAFGRGPDNSQVGSSVSPSPSASGAGGLVPAELRAEWQGGTRSVPGLAPTVGTFTKFTEDSFVLTPSNPVSDQFLTSSASSFGSDQIRVELAESRDGCSQGDVGLYSWSLSTSGRILTLDAESDDCATRLEAMSGVRWKTACEDSNPDAGCLGDLDAGSYSSQYFEPFVPVGGTWKPRFAALTYTVPDGWTNSEDWPGTFGFVSQASADTGISLWSDVVIASSDEACTEEPEPGIGRAVAAMTAWLTAAPGIVASAPVDVSIGGLPGTMLDVSLDPAWTRTCPESGGRPSRAIFTDSVAGDGLHWGLGPDAHVRLFLLDLGDGRTLVVDIESETKANYDALLGEATSIVESFTFPR